jgi:tetratricopeptide (TPR) repeat protein
MPERARALFAQAVLADPAARHGDVYLDYAQLLIAQKEFNLARPVLRTAFRNPANRDAAAIAQWLVAAGRVEQADVELPIFGLRPQTLMTVRRALFDELEKSGNVAAAVKLLDEHTEVFETGMCARLRVAAKTAGVYPQAAALLERLLAQSPLEGAEPARELALLLVDWAEAESSNADAALAHLKRAFELNPALWPAAERLSQLQAERNEPKPAAQTLRIFIDASKNAADVEKARQLLAHLPAS